MAVGLSSNSAELPNTHTHLGPSWPFRLINICFCAFCMTKYWGKLFWLTLSYCLDKDNLSHVILLLSQTNTNITKYIVHVKLGIITFVKLCQLINSIHDRKHIPLMTLNTTSLLKQTCKNTQHTLFFSSPKQSISSAPNPDHYSHEIKAPTAVQVSAELAEPAYSILPHPVSLHWRKNTHCQIHTMTGLRGKPLKCSIWKRQLCLSTGLMRK